MTGKSLADLTAEIREINVAHGWRPAEGGSGGNTFGDYLALLHSEVSEALEAYRDHRLADATESTDHACPDPIDGLCMCPAKPEGVGSELADVLIRLLDMCDVFGVVVSGYERHEDVRAMDVRPLDLVSFGDWITALHVYISKAAERRSDLPLVLRMLVTMTRYYGIDLTAEVERKIAYNRTRSFQHGGRTLAGER